MDEKKRINSVNLSINHSLCTGASQKKLNVVEKLIYFSNSTKIVKLVYTD